MLPLVVLLSFAYVANSLSSSLSAAKIHVPGREAVLADEVLTCLEDYHNQHGHVNVPATFVVPESGLPLGRLVTQLRRRGCSGAGQMAKHRWSTAWSPVVSSLLSNSSTLQRLDELNFTWDVKRKQTELLAKSIDWFKNLHGHTNIPTTYVLPADAPLPNYRLGRRLASLRKKSTAVSSNSASVLESLGLPAATKRRQQFELTLLALDAHNRLYGDFSVPRYFSVPCDESWPVQTWGMQLGNRVRNIRYSGAFQDAQSRAALEKIGFPF